MPGRGDSDSAAMHTCTGIRHRVRSVSSTARRSRRVPTDSDSVQAPALDRRRRASSRGATRHSASRRRQVPSSLYRPASCGGSPRIRASPLGSRTRGKCRPSDDHRSGTSARSAWRNASAVMAMARAERSEARSRAVLASPAGLPALALSPGAVSLGVGRTGTVPRFPSVSASCTEPHNRCT